MRSVNGVELMFKYYLKKSNNVYIIRIKKLYKCIKPCITLIFNYYLYFIEIHILVQLFVRMDLNGIF